jgi:hypothetical protein
MKLSEKLSRTARQIADSIKDVIDKNVTVASSRKQYGISPENVNQVLVLVHASIDEGYERCIKSCIKSFIAVFDAEFAHLKDVEKDDASPKRGAKKSA